MKMEQMVTPMTEPQPIGKESDSFGIPETEINLFRDAQAEFELIKNRRKLVNPWLTAIEE